MGSSKAWLVMWVGGAMSAAVVAGFGSERFSANGGNPGAIDNSALMAETPPQHVPKGDAYSEQQEVEAVPAEAIVLERSEDGHFYADAKVNGQPVRMLVDTGATAIALSRADARRAGISTSIGMQDVVGQGASGEVRGEVVTIDKIAFGNIEAEEFDAVVLDQGEMSLLGQSFLANFDSVEIKGDRMVLR